MSDNDSPEDVPIEQTVAILRKKIGLLMILLIVALALALGAAGYAFMMNRGLAQQIEALNATVTEALDEPAGEPAIEGIVQPQREVGKIHPLGDFVVNLLDPANLRYIKCRIEVEVEDEDVLQELQKREAQVKDMVVSLLGSLTYSDIQGVGGKSRLRQQLLVRINRMLTEGPVVRVYLTELVVQ